MLAPAGNRRDPCRRGPRIAGEPLNPPLVPASNFYESGYAREQGSPGWAPFEEAVGALEGGMSVAFASGMAAISAVLETLPSGGRSRRPGGGLRVDALAARRASLMRAGSSWWGSTRRTPRRRWPPARVPRLLYVETPIEPVGGDRRARRVVRGTVRGGGRRHVRLAVAPAGVVVRAPTSRSRARPSSSAATPTCCSASSRRGRAPRSCTTSARSSARSRASLEAYLALRGLRTLPARLEIAQRSAQVLAERLAARDRRALPGFGRPTRAMNGRRA